MSEPAPLLDITEADFASWKHHPVTKVYHKFLGGFEADIEAAMLSLIRTSATPPDHFKLGELKGFANAIREMATLEYAHIVAFYAPKEEEESNAVQVD